MRGKRRFTFLIALAGIAGSPGVLAGEPPAPTPVTEASCKSVRLDAPGETMEQVQPITQVDGPVDVGACYAFSAAELFDAWRAGGAPAGTPLKRSSPLAAAADFSAWKGRHRGHAGGMADHVLIELVEKGSCDHEAAFRDAGFMDGGDLGKVEARMTHELTEYYEKLNHEILGKRTETDFDTYYIWDKLGLTGAGGVATTVLGLQRDGRRKALARIYAGEAACELRSAPGAIDEKQKQQLLASREVIRKALYDAHGPVEFAKMVFDRLCEGHRIPPLSPKPVINHLESPGNSKRADVISLLNSRFDQVRAQPISALVCYRVFREPAGSPYKKGGDCARSLAHYLPIMGRRWNPASKTCQMLVQNTYSCESLGDKSTWPCENGKIWVDQDALVDNTLELDYLSSSPK